MTGAGPGPNEFYLNYVQQQLDRRFGDMREDMNRRFTTIDMDIKDLKIKVDKLEDAPRDSFRAYVTPILVAVVTAVVLTFLVKQGVVTK